MIKLWNEIPLPVAVAVAEVDYALCILVTLTLAFSIISSMFSEIFALDLPTTSTSANTHVKYVLYAAYSALTLTRYGWQQRAPKREREWNATNLFCDRHAMLMDIKRLYIELFLLNIDTYAPNEYQLPCDVMWSERRISFSGEDVMTPETMHGCMEMTGRDKREKRAKERKRGTHTHTPSKQIKSYTCEGEQRGVALHDQICSVLTIIIIMPMMIAFNAIC